MNVIEALKTGKPLRRPISKHFGAGRTGWLANQYVRDYLTQNTRWELHCEFNLITEVDLMSTDWEINREA